jgi:hypothetical protein
LHAHHILKFLGYNLKTTSKALNLEYNIALYGAETWTLRKVDQKYRESFEIWCWVRMENISLTDRMRNEEVLNRVKEDRNILHTIKRRKANWIGHILRKNCFLKHVIEGKIEGRIEVTERGGRRRKQLLDDLKEKRGYWKLKEEALIYLKMLKNISNKLRYFILNTDYYFLSPLTTIRQSAWKPRLSTVLCHWKLICVACSIICQIRPMDRHQIA